MKNLLKGINIIVAISVVVLYFLHFGQSKTVVSEACVAGEASVVYINTDSLFLNYEMSKDLNEAFLKKQEDRRTKLNIKVKALEKKAVDFQRKLQNNGFLSKDRAEKVQRELLAKREQLQKEQEGYNQEAMFEQREMNLKLYEAITGYLKKFNSKHKYDLILSTTKGGNVLFAKNGFDITETVLNGLNSEYKK